jgi:hypothetical protein
MPHCINPKGFDNGKPSKADRRGAARLRDKQRGVARATKSAGDNGPSEAILPKKQSAPKKVAVASQRTDGAVADSASDSSDEDETPRTTNRFAGLVEDSDSD